MLQFPKFSVQGIDPLSVTLHKNQHFFRWSVGWPTWRFAEWLLNITTKYMNLLLNIQIFRWFLLKWELAQSATCGILAREAVEANFDPMQICELPGERNMSSH